MRLLLLPLLLIINCFSGFSQSDVNQLIQQLTEGYSDNEKKANIRAQLVSKLKEGNSDSLIYRFDLAIESCKKLVGNDAPATAFLHYQKGKILYTYDQNFNQAKISFRNAIQSRKPLIKQAKTNKASLIVYEQALSFFNIGAANYNLKMYQEAIDSFTEAKLLFEQLDNTKKTLQCEQYIGLQHYFLNNIYEAKYWLEKVYKENPNAKSNGKLCLDLGLIRHSLKQYSSAIDVLELAVNNLKSRESPDLYKCYNELALINRNKKEFNLALEYYNNALDAYNAFFTSSQNNEKRINILANIGMSHLNLGDFETSKIYLDSARIICERDTCSLLNLIYHNLGDFHLQKEEFKSAIQFFQKAINQLIPFENHTNLYNNPLINDKVNNAPILIQDYELKGKAFYQWYKESGDAEHLEAAFESYELFKDLMQLMQQQYVNENTELFWLDEFYATIENGLELGFEKYTQASENQASYFNYMLTLIEQNKANVLLENLRKNKALDSSNTTSILEQIGSKQSTAVNNIQERLLDQNTAFLEYFVGDNSVFLISITTDQQSVFQIPVDSLQTNISNIRKLLRPAGSSTSDFKQYAALTHKLYNTFLKPAISNLPSEINTLIIAPDGPFHYIPLDLLLTSPPNAKSWSKNTPYLLKDYNVTYGYSASVLLEQSSLSTSRELPSVIAFAPTYDTNMASLNNQQEVTQIQQLMPTKTYIGEAANRAAYFNAVDKNSILHLATHAIVNEHNVDSTFIALSSGDHLYMNDIYSQSSNASMVVLSACKTGLGTLKRGEGVMSLARAFSTSGIPSTTMSMWSVNDLTTIQIMNAYYKQLSQGDRKPESLRKAKLAYLNQVEEKRFYHPYFWGAFVHYGATDPFRFGSSRLLILLFLGCLIFCSLLIYSKYKKTRQNRA